VPKENGVRVLYGKNGEVFTTIDAINAALGLKAQNQANPTKLTFWISGDRHD